MNTLQAVQLDIPRWMVLAGLGEDIEQEMALVRLLTKTEAQRRDLLKYRVRELRRTQWDRRPVRPARLPGSCRPSKIAGATGYRKDSEAHREARQQVNAESRRAIARKGAQARWNAERFSSL